MEYFGIYWIKLVTFRQFISIFRTEWSIDLMDLVLGCSNLQGNESF
jgi:hypothetical protein